MRGRRTNSAHVFGAEAFHVDLREMQDRDQGTVPQY